MDLECHRQAPRRVEAVATADPVTGQAAWFDLRVRLSPAGVPEDAASEPQFEALPGPAAGEAPLRYGARFRSPEEKA